MASQLTLIDGTRGLIEDRPTHRRYTLEVRLEGAVSTADAEGLGPAVSALYAQTLVAALADPTLGGLVAEVVEGQQDGPGLEVTINRQEFSAPSAEFTLYLTLVYESAPVDQREASLQALTVAVAQNIPTATASVRERCLAALRTEVEMALGFAIARNADRPTEGMAVVMVDGGQNVDHSSQGITIYDCGVAFEVFVPGGSELELDELIQRITAAVRDADRLGGLAIDVTEADVDPEVLRDLYSGPLLGGRVEARIAFATLYGDPTATG